MVGRAVVVVVVVGRVVVVRVAVVVVVVVAGGAACPIPDNRPSVGGRKCAAHARLSIL